MTRWASAVVSMENAMEIEVDGKTYRWHSEPRISVEVLNPDTLEWVEASPTDYQTLVQHLHRNLSGTAWTEANPYRSPSA